MDVELEAELGVFLQGAIRRILWLADRSPNHDHVLKDKIPWGEFEPLLGPGDGRIDINHALVWLKSRMVDGKIRVYSPPRALSGAELLGYGYTFNNRREFGFLQSVCENLGSGTEVVNICDWDANTHRGADAGVQRLIHHALEHVLAPRPSMAPGLLHQLGIFVSSVQGAWETLRWLAPKAFVVANDHSPAPVAYAAVARALGSGLIYLQHAGVTDSFPPLDFDLSILHNRHSAEIYSEVGAGGGKVVTAARHSGPWTSAMELATVRHTLLESRQVTVAVYPSAVVDEDRYRSLVERLLKHPGIQDVYIKPHPNAPRRLPAVGVGRLREAGAILDKPHVAICGNSSIVIELVSRGNIVFQDVSLDALTPDYYGFVADGIAEPWPVDIGRGPFWRRAGEFTAEVQGQLSKYVAHLCTVENVRASLELAPALAEVLRHSGLKSPGEIEEVTQFYQQLLAEPGAAVASVESLRGKDRADGWVLQQLGRIPPGLREFLLHEHLPQNCSSILELWILEAAVERNERVNLIPVPRVKHFAAQYRGEPSVEAWVKGAAKSINRGVGGGWRRVLRRGARRPEGFRAGAHSEASG